MADSRLDNCGCCEGISAETPLPLWNRPRLRAVAYRIGTHSTFKETLLAGLSGAGLSAVAPLRALTTRDDDDFTIGLLDAWATVGDVLTFYQERIANESYLNTAKERFSLVELGRLIDYGLKPGVAATVALAFSVDGPPASITTPAGVPKTTVAGVPQVTVIPSRSKVQSVPEPAETAQTFETGVELQAREAWNALRPRLSESQKLKMGDTMVYLAGTATNLRRGDVLLFVGEERVSKPDNEQWDWRHVASVHPDTDKDFTLVTWNEPLGSKSPWSPPSGDPKVYALRLRASLFGYNAPDPRTFSNQTRSHFPNDLFEDGDAKTEWKFRITGQTIYLDNAYAQILNRSWLILAKPAYQELYLARRVAESSVTNYGITGRSTVIGLDTNENLGEFDGADYRSVAVYAVSEELPQLAERPLSEDATTGTSLSLDVVGDLSDLPKGRLLIVEGIPVGGTKLASEVTTLVSATKDGSFTRLQFERSLQHSYRRSSVTVYANVVEATHGESVLEPPVSGDGSRPYQSFELKQGPLTYVADPRSDAGGVRSTLEVRVNEIAWQEVLSLYQRGRRERIFVTRASDHAKTTVQFGDGVTGSRLPTGPNNVQFTYRRGIGLAGNVKAGQITTLLARPQGVREVINPRPADGGEDAETAEDARTSLPLTVMTLDRIVSLQDYGDFAHAYAGIAKALATWTWSGDQRGVFVTVAGPNGAEISQDSKTMANLLTAMRLKGDPAVPLTAKSFLPRKFSLKAALKVDRPAYERDKVFELVTRALLDAFSFKRRDFGQAVTLSEVVALIQAQEGVLAVDINELRREGSNLDGTKERLTAALPQCGADGVTVAAELLTLDPDGIELSEM